MADLPVRKGRPPIPINWVDVDKLLRIQCTESEIASFVGCSSDTLYRRCLDDHGVTFQAYSKEKREAGKCSLRRAQWKLAEKGNATMLIWLGKNWLNQVDHTETPVSAPLRGVVYPAMTSEMAKEILQKREAGDTGATA